MKKILAVSAITVALIFIVSCGDKAENTGDLDNTGTDVDVANDDDTGNTGDDTDAGNTGDTAVECTGISFDNLALSTEYTGYEGNMTEQIGDPVSQDFISVQFYKEDYSEITELVAGTYNLAEGLNNNYGTCLECVLVYEDIDGEAKTYFQQSGTLTISDIKAGTVESKGTLTAKLVEVTIDSESFESTPVEGGACYEIETGAWDNICIPDCEGKICGTDGCGGKCGDGCEIDKNCNAEGTACVDYTCTALTTISDPTLDTIDAENSFYMYTAAYDPQTGDTDLDDEFMVQLYVSPVAEDSFDLANTNFIDCNQCLLVREDLEYDETSGDLIAVGKVYFQQKGTLAFESFDSATGKVKATITDARLVEVTIASDYTSTPVQGGTCLEVVTGTIEVQ